MKYGSLFFVHILDSPAYSLVRGGTLGYEVFCKEAGENLREEHIVCFSCSIDKRRFGFYATEYTHNIRHCYRK